MDDEANLNISTHINSYNDDDLSYLRLEYPTDGSITINTGDSNLPSGSYYTNGSYQTGVAYNVNGVYSSTVNSVDFDAEKYHQLMIENQEIKSILEHYRAKEELYKEQINKLKQNQIKW